MKIKKSHNIPLTEGKVVQILFHLQIMNVFIRYSVKDENDPL